MEIIEFIAENGVKYNAEILIKTNIGDTNYAICENKLSSGESQIVYVKIELDANGRKVYSQDIDEVDREKLDNLVLALIKEGQND